MPCMKFLFVRPDVCRRLPSDSNSRWTPLPWAMRFPLLGLARDLHPLANAHAERTIHKSRLLAHRSNRDLCVYAKTIALRIIAVNAYVFSLRRKGHLFLMTHRTARTDTDHCKSLCSHSPPDWQAQAKRVRLFSSLCEKIYSACQPIF